MTTLETSLLVLATGVFVLGPALWYADRLRYAFVVGIQDGEVRVRRGKVTAAFLDEVRRVCSEHGVRRGWLGGVRQARRIRLDFSASLPLGCRQQLRNVWGLIGWGNSLPPTRSQRQRR
jgi:hypothetical protein